MKTIYIGKNNDHTTVQLKAMKKHIYAKIRPYKKSNGKRIYGKWSAINDR